jgi:hypothetical protein
VFSHDSRYVAAAGRRELVLIEIATGETTRRTFSDLAAPALRRGPGGFTPLDVVFADDARSLYVTLCNDAGEDNRSAPSGWIQLALPDLSVHAVEILDTSDVLRLLAIAGDGSRLIARTYKNILTVERGDERRMLGSANCHGAGAFSRDGRWAATFGTYEVEVWDLTSGTRLEYFRLPNGGRNRHVFEYERVALATLMHRIDSGLRDTADIALAPDRVHVVTASPGGVEVWRLGEEPRVRHLATTESSHVAISPDGTTVAAIAAGERDYSSTTEHATIRISGLFASPPATLWPSVPYRALDSVTVQDRRRRANELLDAMARGEHFVQHAHELVSLRDSTPALREDLAVVRRIHRATVPYGVPIRVAARRILVHGAPVRQVEFTHASDRVVLVEASGRAVCMSLDDGIVIQELELGRRTIEGIGNSDRTLLCTEKDPTADDSPRSRYCFIASCVDLASGRVTQLGPCTAVAIHPSRDEVLIDRGQAVERFRTDGTRLVAIQIPGRLPRFTADGALLRLITYAPDRIDIYRYDALDAGAVSSGPLEILLGGRPDPTPSADGRHVDMSTRYTDGPGYISEGRHASLLYDRGSIRIAPRVGPPLGTSPIAPGHGGVLGFSPDCHLLALHRAGTVELWALDYECDYLEEAADQLAAWPAAVDDRRELLDRCLDRWSELRRLAARPHLGETGLGHLLVARDSLLAHLERTLASQPVAEVVARIQLVDPELAAAYADHASPPGTRTCLRVIAPESRTIPLDKNRPNVIGRHPKNDIQLIGDLTVAKEHCTIRRDENGRWWFRDHETANGSTIDGERVRGERELQHGARVVLGSATIIDFDGR